MRLGAALVVAIVLAGCAHSATPPETATAATAPPRGLPTLTYPCLAGASPLVTGGLCAQTFRSATGAVMAQAIVASPIDPRTYAMAIYANDAAQTPSAATEHAVPAWTSWLLVSTDGGGTWTRRDLPPIDLPDLGDATGIGNLLLSDLQFAPDGTLHAALAVQRGDASLVSHGIVGGIDTPGTNATQPWAVHAMTKDLGQTWSPPQVLGAMGDYRMIKLGAWTDQDLAVVWSGAPGDLRLAATHDGGATWQTTVASPSPCTRIPVVSRVAQGLLVQCAGSNGVAILAWDAMAGDLQRIADLERDDAMAIDGSGLASDGVRNVTFVAASSTAHPMISHDGGHNWSDGPDLATVAAPAADWSLGTSEPSPSYDPRGDVHVLASLVHTTKTAGLAEGEDASALVHIVLRPDTGAARANQVLPPHAFPNDASLAAPGIGYLGPVQNFAFQGDDGLFIVPMGGWFGLVHVHMSD